jgi:hypothetical protein
MENIGKDRKIVFFDFSPLSRNARAKATIQKMSLSGSKSGGA